MWSVITLSCQNSNPHHPHIQVYFLAPTDLCSFFSTITAINSTSSQFLSVSHSSPLAAQYHAATQYIDPDTTIPRYQTVHPQSRPIHPFHTPHRAARAPWRCMSITSPPGVVGGGNLGFSVPVDPEISPFTVCTVVSTVRRIKKIGRVGGAVGAGVGRSNVVSCAGSEWMGRTCG